ncbi:hypothetical protein [Paracoccus shanxieyensis]|uniref:Uncharacterized protein n=1 Tax=Paracoccus shanxieyensis TaxID=2675752 RepID=A0A6L6J708_9RHOB|nr:hypothetical protein [Paracoccus shanxieyensis]MTH66577.1 hypothetical protein [Paracoccus shanxieyensis]MTH89812.1 hypothetical protein [Paracoccus shanxieyensis]
MFTTSPLERLRRLRWLEMLPDNIDVPAVFDRPDQAVPIERATVDDLEFALVALARQQSGLCHRTSALGDVLKMARRQGACGADIAISAAVRDLEGGK